MSMWRRFVAALIAACISYAPVQSAAVLKSAGAPPCLTSAGAVCITGGTIAGVSGVPTYLTGGAIPIVILPTTTYNNNGAATAGTALPVAYGNFYAVVPANSIAAGTPASTSIYFAQASTTTAITLFNNLMSANLDANGNPTIPASPTAFVTTGAGSVAGVTGTVTLLTYTVAAGTIGTAGEYQMDLGISATSNANGKTLQVTFGGTSIINSGSLASNAAFRWLGAVANMGGTSTQYMSSVLTGASVSTGQQYGAINTANAVSVTIGLAHGTATDVMALERYRTFLVK